MNESTQRPYRTNLRTPDSCVAGRKERLAKQQVAVQMRVRRNEGGALPASCERRHAKLRVFAERAEGEEEEGDKA